MEIAKQYIKIYVVIFVILKILKEQDIVAMYVKIMTFVKLAQIKKNITNFITLLFMMKINPYQEILYIQQSNVMNVIQKKIYRKSFSMYCLF